MRKATYIQILLVTFFMFNFTNNNIQAQGRSAKDVYRVNAKNTSNKHDRNNDYNNQDSRSNKNDRNANYNSNKNDRNANYNNHNVNYSNHYYNNTNRYGVNNNSYHKTYKSNYAYGYNNGYNQTNYNHNNIYNRYDRMPYGTRTFYLNRTKFYYTNGYFYQRMQNRGYVMVAAPINIIIDVLPHNYRKVIYNGEHLYVSNGNYFKRTRHGYCVVNPAVRMH